MSPFLETVREKAQVERINVDVAAISVAQELRNYRINGGLQRQIEIAQGQLKMINITIAQKEKPLLILAEFQDRGIDLEKICRELNTWAGPGPFGNNHSNYSPTVNGNGQKAQSYLDQNLGSNNNPSGDKALELVNQIWDQVERTTSS
jgi:hypothetical protein